MHFIVLEYCEEGDLKSIKFIIIFYKIKKEFIKEKGPLKEFRAVNRL